MVPAGIFSATTSTDIFVPIDDGLGSWADSAWVGYRFGSAVDVAKVAVGQRVDGLGGYHWTSCDVDYSNDGVFWYHAGRCAFASPTSATDTALKVASISGLTYKTAQSVAGVTRCGASASRTAAPKYVQVPSYYIDTEGGMGQIVGSVSGIGPPVTPLARRVLLLDEQTRRVVRETWSDSSGAYVFSNLDLSKRYTAVCHDNAGVYRAVAADRLAPTAM
jgi:hypothetical protein